MAWEHICVFVRLQIFKMFMEFTVFTTSVGQVQYLCICTTRCTLFQQCCVLTSFLRANWPSNNGNYDFSAQLHLNKTGVSSFASTVVYRCNPSRRRGLWVEVRGKRVSSLAAQSRSAREWRSSQPKVAITSLMRILRERGYTDEHACCCHVLISGIVRSIDNCDSDWF
jgi:hypothetical protein